MKRSVLFIISIIIAVEVFSQRLQVQGKVLISNNGDTIILQGFNWGWWGLAQQGDAEAACIMGANAIRMPMRWYFGNGGNDQRDTTKPGNISPEGLAILDQQIQWCADNHLWVILFGGSDRGAGDDDRNFWTDNLLKQQFTDMWQFLANRYKYTPYIAAYEILSEPHPQKPITNAQLRSFYKELADSIRMIDPFTPVMIGANDHYDINLMDSIFSGNIPNLFYTFNYYLPTDYVKPDKRAQQGLPIVSYPDNYTDFDGNYVIFDKNYLNQLLQIGISFRDKYNVPIFINQVAARSRCPNYLQYTMDVLDLFEENKVGYTYWTWRTTSDSTEHGLYWQNSTDKQFYLKQDLYNVIDEKLGDINLCSQPSGIKKHVVSMVKIYPNPSNQEIHVELNSPKPFQMEIINNLNKVIIKAENKNILDISNLVNGVYILKIKQGHYYTVTKFIKH